MGEITIAILVVAIVILSSMIDYKNNKEQRERDENCPCPQTCCFNCDREFCRWRKT